MENDCVGIGSPLQKCVLQLSKLQLLSKVISANFFAFLCNIE